MDIIDVFEVGPVEKVVNGPIAHVKRIGMDADTDEVR